MIRHILPPCPDCRGPGGRPTEVPRSSDPCRRCLGIGVLLDVKMPVLDRQIINAWRDEPTWHRAARERSWSEGRPGFFQSPL